MYDARIERLPEPTRRLLLLAVLDGSGDLGVLAAASGPGGLDDLGPAERDHLIVVDDRSGELRFRHPMIKSVVVERSTHDERRAAHLRLAELFAGSTGTARPSPRRGGVRAGRGRSPPRSRTAPIAPSNAATSSAPSPGCCGRPTSARTRRTGADGWPTRRTSAPTPPDSSTARRSCCATPIAGIRRSARRSTRRSPPPISSSTATATRRRRISLLTVAIESALDEPDQDRDGLSEGLYTLVLVCHYAGRAEYWAPFHDAMSRLGATAPTDVRLLAETFADPVTAPDWALSELDHEIEQLRNTDDDALIIRTAIAGFYIDRLPALPRGAVASRPGRTRGRRRRLGDDGAVHARLRRAQRRPMGRSAAARRRGHRAVRGARIPVVCVERPLRHGAHRRQPRGSRGVSGDLSRR